MKSVFNTIVTTKKSRKTQHWSFRKPDGRSKEAMQDKNPVLRVKKRGDLYQVGNYNPAPLEDVREYARVRSAKALMMGCVSLKF